MIEDPTAIIIVNFLTAIGLEVRTGTLSEDFLPGIRIDAGVMTVDPARLSYCGDLLHEAGHLAVLPSAERNGAAPNVSKDGGEEMAAIAWSYAAAFHLGLDPKIVFHDGGYRGGSDSIVENFGEGRYFGVPLLEWMGLTATKSAAERGVPPYPYMIRWLRD
jgi:hypothetical protein